MVVAPTLPDKVIGLEKAMQRVIFERDEVIHTMVLAVVGKLHHYQLGVPGTGKTKLFSVMKSLIEVPPPTFEILMTRYTQPDEIVGTRDIAAMKEGRVRFITKGMAPEATLWLYDEIFKGNSSILNYNLWALNERRFRNDGDVHDLPLWSLFSMSNELPESEELNALFDRIHFRHQVHPIKEPGVRVQMLKGQFATPEAPVITWDEIVQAHAESQAVVIPDEVFEAVNQVQMELRALEIEPSDRRLAESLKAVQAEAWLDGESEANINHLSPLIHMLWEVPEQYIEVYKVIGNLADPLDKEASDLVDEVEKLDSRLTKLLKDDTMDPIKRQKEGVEIHRASRSAKTDYRKLREATKNSKKKSQKVEECRVKLLALTRRLLDSLFDMDDVPDDTDLEA